jgi:flagellar hook protein FlgE
VDDLPVEEVESELRGQLPGQLVAPGADVVGGAATPFTLKTGTLTFDGDGTLTGVDGGSPADVTITTPAWSNGAAASTMKWTILDGTRPMLSGYASPSGASSISQNGTGAGMVDNLSINSDGMIVATFGGGKTVPVAQLALASFNNAKGLVKLGSNRYGESESAGLPNIGIAGTGGRGTIIGSALEQSNVDIAQEFTAMILAQRGYQANSKTITVSDEVLVETLNLKR